MRGEFIRKTREENKLVELLLGHAMPTNYMGGGPP